MVFFFHFRTNESDFFNYSSLNCEFGKSGTLYYSLLTHRAFFSIKIYVCIFIITDVVIINFHIIIMIIIILIITIFICVHTINSLIRLHLCIHFDIIQLLLLIIMFVILERDKMGVKCYEKYWEGHMSCGMK